MKEKIRVIGVDVGTATTGWSVVEKSSRSKKLNPLGYGIISTEAGLPQAERLAMIYADLQVLIQKYQPDAAAVEILFFYNNQTTAMAVSQSRGVVLLALQQAGIKIGEYTPLQVKSAVTGYGKAEKKQVQEMVKLILGLEQLPKPDDAADALALAICYLNDMNNFSSQL